tara:strand:+ start:268 stop:447 length:180 start_codon:yes stop_codon:yes gene_type:complete
MTFTSEYWKNYRKSKRQTDKCAIPQCNAQVFGDQFYCDYCKDRMQKSVYGDYFEVKEDW